MAGIKDALRICGSPKRGRESDVALLKHRCTEMRRARSFYRRIASESEKARKFFLLLPKTNFREIFSFYLQQQSKFTC